MKFQLLAIYGSLTYIYTYRMNKRTNGFILILFLLTTYGNEMIINNDDFVIITYTYYYKNNANLIKL